MLVTNGVISHSMLYEPNIVTNGVISHSMLYEPNVGDKWCDIS